MSNTSSLVAALTAYGIKNGLLAKEDEIYVRNRLLHALSLDEYDGEQSEDEGAGGDLPLEQILAGLMEDAIARGVLSDDITSRDLFDTELMAQLMPRPSEVIKKFKELYEKSPEEATDWYYAFSKASDYIRTYRVKKDMKWITKTEYGDLDITINLSKPEKDPKAIAAALKAKASNYPKCLLCKENEGYAGRGNHPGRGNHRIIPMELNGENFFLQYSPYVYYNEHCIVFNSEHTPMKIDHAAFCKLLDFVTLFPHYFIGSNADLPIVGGSILTHDHFQGGRYEFPMAKAGVEETLEFRGFPDVKAGIVKWPMSVIRLSGSNKKRIIALADKILAVWRGYSDERAFVFAETDGVPHNTITPIARRRGEDYELDLVLRNNIQTEEHPLGVYHPHAEHHHIKKENIGLIEVMGLAVLPARLKAEMEALVSVIKNTDVKNGDDKCVSRTEKSGMDPSDGKTGMCGKETAERIEAAISENETVSKHLEWIKGLENKYEGLFLKSKDELTEVLHNEIGLVYCDILAQAGVYKRNEDGKAAFLRFVDAVNRE